MTPSNSGPTTSVNIEQVCQFLEHFAPTRLAEDWDNVGLLVGDPQLEATRIMTCLTITPESAAEAIDRQVNLIVAHHPLPFRSLKTITTHSVPTKMLWELIRAGVSIYSPHTGFDSATAGINQSLGERLELTDLQPIQPIPDDPDQLGSGRIGNRPQPQSLAEFIAWLKPTFNLPTVEVVGAPDHQVHRVAIACGSGGSFLGAAMKRGCDTLVTGETTFHTALEAKANGVALVLLGHYHSERFAVEMLADKLQSAFPKTDVWASAREVDPIRFA